MDELELQAQIQDLEFKLRNPHWRGDDELHSYDKECHEHYLRDIWLLRHRKFDLIALLENSFVKFKEINPYRYSLKYRITKSEFNREQTFFRIERAKLIHMIDKERFKDHQEVIKQAELLEYWDSAYPYYTIEQKQKSKEVLRRAINPSSFLEVAEEWNSENERRISLFPVISSCLVWRPKETETDREAAFYLGPDNPLRIVEEDNESEGNDDNSDSESEGFDDEDSVEDSVEDLYDKHNNEPIKGSYTCPICLIDNVQPNSFNLCGHCVCNICALKLSGTSKLCPICKKEINGFHPVFL
jgi:hypothetical protein